MALIMVSKTLHTSILVDAHNTIDMMSDFNYIDGIVEGMSRTHGRVPQPNPDHLKMFLPQLEPLHPTEFTIYDQILLTSLMGNFYKKKVLQEKPSFMPMQDGDTDKSNTDVENQIKILITFPRYCFIVKFNALSNGM